MRSFVCWLASVKDTSVIMVGMMGSVVGYTPASNGSSNGDGSRLVVYQLLRVSLCTTV